MTAASPLDAAKRLLRRSRLPYQDLDASAHLRVIEDDGEVVGCVAVEVYGTTGLLRSLAVARSHRGQGLGTTLVETAEAVARDLGLDALVLLTTTAAPFFEALGYVWTARAAVPQAVRESSEFTSTCSASAICMRKTREDHGPQA